MQERPIDILMVEDNPNDVVITGQALARSQVPHRLWVSRDGQEALDFLHRRDNFSDPQRSPRPDLILLDLNLPRLDGFEVLRSVKSDPSFRRIPIIILTTSEREEDITQAYLLGANTYIAKPLEFEQFQHDIRTVYEYWCRVARLPSMSDL